MPGPFFGRDPATPTQQELDFVRDKLKETTAILIECKAELTLVKHELTILKKIQIQELELEQLNVTHS